MSTINLTNQDAPDTPDTGECEVYVDSSTKKLATKDDSGTVTVYGSGGGGGGVANLQQAYDGATNPEITLEDVANRGLTIRDSATNVNRDNVLNIENTSGSKVSFFTRLGQTLNGFLSIVNQVAGTVALTLKAAASQTADIFKVTDSSDTNLFAIENDGTIRIRESTGSTDRVISHLGDSQCGIAMFGTGGSFRFYIRNDTSLTFEINQNSLTHSGKLRTSLRGSTSAPSFTYSGDAGSGMSFPVNDELSLSAGGTHAMNFTTTLCESKLPHKMPSYATASLPSAATFIGCFVYDSDTNEMKYSNGTSWVAM